MQSTTVIYEQPFAGGDARIYPSRDWLHPLCSCFDDCRECSYAFFCPICHMCELTTRIDESCWSIFFGRVVPMRTKIRTERKIQGSIASDCCILTFCSFCAIVQMSREAKETRPLI